MVKKLTNNSLKDAMSEGVEAALDKTVSYIQNGRFSDAQNIVFESGSELFKEAKVTKIFGGVVRGYKNVQVKKMMNNLVSFFESATPELLTRLYDEYSVDSVIDQVIFDVLDTSAADQAKVIGYLTNAFSDGLLSYDEFRELVYATKQLNPAGLKKEVKFENGKSGWLLGGMTPYLLSLGLAYSLAENSQKYSDQETRFAMRGISTLQPEVVQNKYVVTPLGYKFIELGVRPFQAMSAKGK